MVKQCLEALSLTLVHTFPPLIRPIERLTYCTRVICRYIRYCYYVTMIAIYAMPSLWFLFKPRFKNKKKNENPDEPS